MKISEKSWHFRIVNLCSDRPNDLCSYFWTLVRNLLVGAGMVAVIGFAIFLVGYIGYDYVAQNYIVIEKGWEGYQPTSSWRIKTKEEVVMAKAIEAENITSRYGSKEKFAKVRAEQNKEFFWDAGKAIAILSGIAVFIIFGIFKEESLNYRLAQKISAFSMIPAVATTIGFMYFTGFYGEFISHLGTHHGLGRNYGECAFIAVLHPIIITFVWIILKSLADIVASVIVKLTEEKDLTGVGVALGFIKAKKEKVCPMIDYT